MGCRQFICHDIIFSNAFMAFVYFFLRGACEGKEYLTTARDNSLQLAEDTLQLAKVTVQLGKATLQIQSVRKCDTTLESTIQI